MATTATTCTTITSCSEMNAENQHSQEEHAQQHKVEEIEGEAMSSFKKVSVENHDNNDNNYNNNKTGVVYRILALYHFVKTEMTDEQVHRLKQDLLNTLLPQKVRGSILLAREGINGTICYPIDTSDIYNTDDDENHQHDSESEKDAVQEYLLNRFPELRTRLSYYHEPVFARFKVRIKKEIVTMGIVNDHDDDEYHDNNNSHSNSLAVQPACRVGEYVTSAAEWDALIRDPNCLVIDTRNDYEYQLGTFENAVNPGTTCFSEFPSWMEQQLANRKTQNNNNDSNNNNNTNSKMPDKIAMFCTGGIRCEKATSYVMSLADRMSNNGGQGTLPSSSSSSSSPITVYHLKGGILAYLDTVRNEHDSSFKGECFVFDGRTAVTHGLRASDKYRLCHACRHPLTTQDRSHPDYQLGISCPYCFNDDTRRRQRYVDRQVQIELHQSWNKPHIHDAKECTATTAT